MSLLYGDFNWLEVSPTTMAYMRTYMNEITIVLFNKGTNQAPMTLRIPERFAGRELSSIYGAQMQWNNANLNISLAPGTFEVLTSE